MSDSYQGMRWYKCDLHIHTPADSRHWNNSQKDVDKNKTAETFIRRCYEERLECIAITDHNFKSKDFIPLLKDAAIHLKQEYGYQMIIFPGFEITADIGRGIHVLAMFEPDIPLENIDHILTNCGVPMPRQEKDGSNKPSLKRLKDILGIVQEKAIDGRLNGIVICPHITNESGLFDNSRISEWLQMLEWQNPDLYAVEITKPIKEMNENWRCLFENGEDCERKWRRIRPIAAIMSSDCKAFHESECPNNYIGKRFTWIKMSRPSIESLRQAFLDPNSRICLEAEPPAAKHTYVKRISINETKFLADQTVYFSPHLNCIIGGRGSGKSMLFESLRLGLRGETALNLHDDSTQLAANQIHRLWHTFTDSTQIELEVSHDGLLDQFQIKNMQNKQSRVMGREVDDEPTVFRLLNTLIFSQEEITELSSRPEILIEFIDNLVMEKLEKPRQEANIITEQIKAARQEKIILNRMDKELAALDQEVKELSRQLETRTLVQEDLKNHRAAQEAHRYLQSLIKKAEEIEKNINALTEELEGEPPPLGSSVETFPEKTFFSQVDKNVSDAYRILAESIRSIARNFMEKFQQATYNHPDWKTVEDAINQAELRFETACREKGLTAEEADRLREIELKYRSRNADFLAKQMKKNSLKSKQPNIKKLFNKLTQCWHNETMERQKFLEEILNNNTMPRTINSKPIIDISITFAGNRKAFLKAWGQLAPDRRKVAGRFWDDYDQTVGKNNVGDQLFEAFHEYINQKVLKENFQTSEDEIFGNPVQWLDQHLNSIDLPPLIEQYLEEIKTVRSERPDEWINLLLMRIPDMVDLTLRRHDDSVAGSFVKNDLSIGQKNTAILSLLLASGNGPIFIDQPEDQLDSQFLFQELVPMIRNVREKRQMIIVTHNANIPVNADAELVYALEAREGRGKCCTQGGLDRPEVARAVLDIMEGSEEAFRRRKEKYHF